MKNLAIVFCSAIFMCTILTGIQASAAAEFLVGVAEEDITIKGYPVLDPIFAKAMVFRQGEEKVALVVCDMVGVNYEIIKDAREDASEKTGIPAANIAIAGTHTHHGRTRTFYWETDRLVGGITERLAADLASQPSEAFALTLAKELIKRKGKKDLPAEEAKEITEKIMKAIDEEFPEKPAPEATEEEVSEYNSKRKTMLSEQLNAELRERFKVARAHELVGKISKAIVDAYNSAAPTTFHSGAKDLYGHAFCRRYLMKDGSIKYNPEHLSPDLIRPMSPTDPEVGFIVFNNAADDTPVSSLSSFPMHVCTLGPVEGTTSDGREYFSADYPYYIKLALQKEFGKDFFSLFGQGTSGDINHVDSFNPKAADGLLEAKRHGDAIAGIIIDALPTIGKSDKPSLAVRKMILEMPFNTVTDEEIAWKNGEPTDPEKAALWETIPAKRRTIKRLEEMRKKDPYQAEVHAFRLSEDVAIIAMPGEIFVGHGLNIKKASPFPTTIIITIANSRNLGYIATQEAADQAVINSYKILTARISPKGGEIMVEAAVKMLNELKAELQ